MNQSKQNFLANYTCAATRLFASHLYDLEQASIATETLKVSERVLEIVTFYEIIPESELASYGIELTA